MQITVADVNKTKELLLPFSRVAQKQKPVDHVGPDDRNEFNKAFQTFLRSVSDDKFKTVTR